MAALSLCGRLVAVPWGEDIMTTSMRTTTLHSDPRIQRAFESAWRVAVARELGIEDTESLPVDSVTIGLAPRLIDLLMESHHQPIDQFEGVVRRLVIEQHFVGENGDDSMDEAIPLGVDRHVRVLVMTLEHVRNELLGEGKWSEAPVTPLMFG